MRSVLSKGKSTTIDYWFDGGMGPDSFNRFSAFAIPSELPRGAAADRLAYAAGEAATSSLAIAVSGPPASADVDAAVTGDPATTGVLDIAIRPAAEDALTGRADGIAAVGTQFAATMAN